MSALSLYRQDSTSTPSHQPSEYSCYLVFESAILLLFSVCRNCLSKAVDIKRTSQGSLLRIKHAYVVITDGNGTVNQCVAVYLLEISPYRQLFCMPGRYQQRLLGSFSFWNVIQYQPAPFSDIKETISGQPFPLYGTLSSRPCWQALERKYKFESLSKQKGRQSRAQCQIWLLYRFP